MGVLDRIPTPELGVVGWPNFKRFFHKIVTTTGGTIDAANSSTAAQSGVTVAKTGSETGRYTFTLPRTYPKFWGVSVTKIGPDDAIWGANTTGYDHFVRDNDVDGGALDGTFELQFTQNGSNADAEIPDAAQFIVEIMVSDKTM